MFNELINSANLFSFVRCSKAERVSLVLGIPGPRGTYQQSPVMPNCVLAVKILCENIES